MERLGEHFPKHTLEKSIFIEGGAFLIKQYEFRNEGLKDRRFFILNKNPSIDSVIITVHVTTKIETRKAVRPPEVLVEIKCDEYMSLGKDSIVDCESYNVWNKKILCEKIAKGEIEVLSQLPVKILNKLRTAISNSKTLSPIDKRLIFPEE